MTPDDDIGAAVLSTLEGQELAVKRSIESFGDLETAFERAVSELENEEAALEPLEQLGKALEMHESRLERVVEALDDHKRVLRRLDDHDGDALTEAMERARRRARQETGPPSPDRGER